MAMLNVVLQLIGIAATGYYLGMLVRMRLNMRRQANACKTDDSTVPGWLLCCGCRQQTGTMCSRQADCLCSVYAKRSYRVGKEW